MSIVDHITYSLYADSFHKLTLLWTVREVVEGQASSTTSAQISNQMPAIWWQIIGERHILNSFSLLTSGMFLKTVWAILPVPSRNFAVILCWLFFQWENAIKERLFFLLQTQFWMSEIMLVWLFRLLSVNVWVALRPEEPTGSCSQLLKPHYSLPPLSPFMC